MNFYLLRSALFTLAFLIISISSIAQEISQSTEKRTVGLSASVASDQFDIIVPLWTNSTTVFAPSVRLINVEGQGTDFGIGAALRKYFYEGDFMPFVSGRAGLLLGFPQGENAENTTDAVFGLSIGGEYFLSHHFSFAVEAQTNLTVSDERSIRFGNAGGNTFNTGMAVTASIWF